MEYEHNLVKQSKSNTKCIYSYINSKTKIKNTIRAIRDINSDITTNGKTICNTLNTFFSSVFIIENSKNIPLFEKKTFLSCPYPKLEKLLIETKLIKNKLNTNKTTGVDKVYTRVLKECLQSLFKPLESMFNQSFESATPPNLWLHANITPLHIKDDILEPANYIPIS
nr:uncharacterized protein LOC124808622 [Hydra vulgaris]